MSKKQIQKSPKLNSQHKSVPPAMQVFSRTRDSEGANPYHLDGDIEMYSQQKLQQRKALSQDQDILKELERIVKMYQLSDGKILEPEYKRLQKKMALALRPDIDEEQLEFVVDEDWKLDQTDGYILPNNMVHKIFEMVDMWTIGVDKEEYISFVRLLIKKLERKHQ